MADPLPNPRSDMPPPPSEAPPVVSGQRPDAASHRHSLTSDIDSASGPRSSGGDETQDAPLELQRPVSSMPSKYDLAKRRIGVVLDDKWRLESLLGVGGMAAVYAATHRNGARAAIKLLPFTLATGPEVCQRLLREGYLANRIQHSAVTRVLDDHIDYDKEHAYIVMELLEGETARQRVERLGPFGPKEAVDLMLELADCLRAAHTANVVHRDIKPENLFLTVNGLKVLDFGIARALDGNSSLTQTGTSLGTPAYMSPEQARGKHGEIGPRSDIYSLGATLLFLLTGQNLHEGENALELMVRAAWTPALPAHELCPTLPGVLAMFIDRCCAFDPDQRFSSVDELMTSLRTIDGLPEHINPTSRSVHSKSAPDSARFDSRLETLSASEPPRRMRSSRHWWIAALALGGAGVSWWVIEREPSVDSSRGSPPEAFAPVSAPPSPAPTLPSVLPAASVATPVTAPEPAQPMNETRAQVTVPRASQTRAEAPVKPHRAEPPTPSKPRPTKTSQVPNPASRARPSQAPRALDELPDLDYR